MLFYFLLLLRSSLLFLNKLLIFKCSATWSIHFFLFKSFYWIRVLYFDLLHFNRDRICELIIFWAMFYSFSLEGVENRFKFRNFFILAFKHFSYKFWHLLIFQTLLKSFLSIQFKGFKLSLILLFCLYLFGSSTSYQIVSNQTQIKNNIFVFFKRDEIWLTYFVFGVQ